jgi:hypothetical protein
MPNSDNQDGVFNKITKEIRFYKLLEDSSDEVIAQSFSGNVETAKSTMLHADALTCNDTNGTQLDYAITADGNGIKFTIAFGTKGTAGIAEADDWADTWTTTKATLVAADKWIKATTYIHTDKDENDDDVDVAYPVIWKSIDATPHLF